ncbi:rhodanese-like domain-containing protein [Sediminicoccus rosea]|uniref:Rhodanese-like domain-containing protein n=1 Tax=Sediminicoccus rosea TaxID=1225128 RepID=A0ABZ0PL05_9PROT|nr:rhodanese-like domain-containing protein [Sediminicoccus rosea]WPB86430.1 rhodanese-like domain-containing protein [Sediminicoccus rosea]
MAPFSRPTRRSLLFAGAGALAVTGGTALALSWPRGLPDPANPRTTMRDVEAAVARLLPVPEITSAELARRIGTGERILLLDVREPAEYAQSRIPGALRVPPDAPAGAVLAELGTRMAGTTVVLYCAVGWRSGLMLKGIRQAAAEAPAAALLNLRGGIFRWHAEHRPLELAAGAEGVHQFNAAWGLLLQRLTGS